MKKNWPYYLVLLLVVAFLYTISRKTAHEQIDWGENFTAGSKDPFGCYVVRELMDETMESDIDDVDRTAYVQLADSLYRNSNYFFVNSHFEPSAQDVIKLCRFVHDGNTVMISARSFGMLHDTLKFWTQDALMLQVDDNTTVSSAYQAGSSGTQANLVNPSLKLPKNAVFDRTTYSVAFSRVDTVNTTVLGVDGDGNVNFIRVRLGKGEFLLHSLPDAFANYYAGDKATGPYLFRALSYLPDRPTFFDEHYKTGRRENVDPRRYLFSEPALRLTYMVLIVTGLIALFFGGRRRQRAVPVVKPPTNSTLEFVEQVGALYYRQGNHTDIVRKKINYFLESVRSRFYVQTQVFDEKFLERITNLSGAPREQVQQLFATIDYLRSTPACGERDLKNIEQLTWNFNKRSKR